MTFATGIRGMTIVGAITAALGVEPPDASRPRPPRPVAAIAGIIDAFGSHPIVALPDAHGDEQMHQFLLSLIRDPRFIQTVDDIVIEVGNARYQPVADRFVRGEHVADEELRLAWRNSTQPSLAADFFTHDDLFRTVRAVNASASRGRRLRILLGDPPIDWNRIRTKDEHFKWIEMRDAYPAAVLQLEVIAKQRRALLVYGVGHLQRKNVLSNFEMEDWRAQTVVSLIERSGPTRVFTIVGSSSDEVQKEATACPPPCLLALNGTTLGAIDAAQYFGPPGRFAVRNGKLVPLAPDQWLTLPAENQFDAVLYLGPPAAGMREPLSARLCTEPGYLEMRLNRIALAGLPPVEADRVRRLCAGSRPQ